MDGSGGWIYLTHFYTGGQVQRYKVRANETEEPGALTREHLLSWISHIRPAKLRAN